MADSELSVSESLKEFAFRHSGALATIVILVGSWALDRLYFGAWLERYLGHELPIAASRLFAEQSDMRVILLLPICTLLLAFSNLYLKISIRSSNIQRRLTAGSFVNLAFAIYFAVYLLLAILAYAFLHGKISNWFVNIVLAAIVGIGAANTDIKFGGMSLQPLAEFLQSLEAVVEAGMGTDLNELDIAKRASLRDRLASVPKARLERECIFLGMATTDLATLQSKASDDATYVGLLCIEIIKKSEANAWRLLAESSRDASRYRIRWWSRH
jgi:hypothetical protein